jgi:phage nucleotide-binding protein
MAISLTSTRQSAQLTGLKFLVHGPAGAGKTSLCATTGEPTVIISAESGLLSLSRHDIPVIEVKTLDQMYEAYDFVANSEEGQQFKWVCLDSISEIAEVVLNHEKKVAKDPRQAYGALAEKMTDLIRAFRDLPGRNVYFSCKQERTKDEQTGAMLYFPSMPGNMLKQGVGYFFDFVFALRVEKDGDGNPTRWLQTARDFSYEAKDRSGALDSFEAPDLAAIAAKVTSQTAI